MMTTKNKPYEMPEAKLDRAAEPMAEYGMDINTLKLKTIEQLMLIDSKELLKKALSYLNQLKGEQQSPAQMTLEELKEVLKESEKESRLGLGLTQEEMTKEIGS